MLPLDLAIAGIGIGAVAAVAGLGLLVTYRLTGVFNLAFGAVAMFSAYLLWWMVRVLHWPVGLAALIVLGVVCPAIGLILDRFVFRPLQQRRATSAELLTATVGVFVLLVGTAFALWGGQARTDAPSLMPTSAITLPGDTIVRFDTLVELIVVLILAISLAVVLRTRAGLTIRAAVEGRELAELAGVNTNRVSAIGWVIGSVLAGLAGMLLAPALRLDPYTLTLLVLETMVVVVVARLTRPAVAIAAALAIGVAQSELTQIHLIGRASTVLQALTSNLFVVALLITLLVLRRLDQSSDNVAGLAHLATRRQLRPPRGWWVPALVLLAVPFMLSQELLRTAQAIPALALVLLSIVVLSGYGGQISLGQAGFAGMGALLTARLAAGDLLSLPAAGDIAAIAFGAMLVVPIGLLTGWPAIRRRGLFLALTTFAVGAVLSRFVFAQPAFISGVVPTPPDAFRSDDGFYAFELACLGAGLFLVRNLHRGRLGRALLAMRDNEAGARASGIDVTRLKVFLFGIASAIAAVGGTLMAQSARAFDAETFDPVQSLLWFATVVVFGLDSATGAVLGAAMLVALDAGTRAGISTIVIGVGAVMLGRTPGGVLFWLRRSITSAVSRPPAGPQDRTGQPGQPGQPVRLSPAGLAIASKFRR